MAEKKYKRIMTAEDDLLGITLQNLLDKETISYDDKLAIIKWFDSFDYPKNETTLDGILRIADNLNW